MGIRDVGLCWVITDKQSKGLLHCSLQGSQSSGSSTCSEHGGWSEARGHNPAVLHATITLTFCASAHRQEVRLSQKARLWQRTVANKVTFCSGGCQGSRQKEKTGDLFSTPVGQLSLSSLLATQAQAPFSVGPVCSKSGGN